MIVKKAGEGGGGRILDFRLQIGDRPNRLNRQMTEVRGQRSEVRDLEILNQLPLGFA